MEIRALARLQAALELHDKAMPETFFQDCVKGEIEVCRGRRLESDK